MQRNTLAANPSSMRRRQPCRGSEARRAPANALRARGRARGAEGPEASRHSRWRRASPAKTREPARASSDSRERIVADVGRASLEPCDAVREVEAPAAHEALVESE